MKRFLLVCTALVAFWAGVVALAATMIQPYRFASAGGGPSLIVSLSHGTTNGGGGGTTSAIDTTGANFMCVAVATYGAEPTLTDSKSNTWTGLTAQSAGGFHRVRLYYCYGGTVGSGHTFTASSGYTTITILAFSGVATSPFDVESGGSATSTTTIQPGSISPAQSNTLQIVAWEQDTQNVTPSVNESFATAVYVTPTGGHHVGGGMSYRVATSSAAVNPTVTFSGTASVLECVIAAFKY